MKNNKLVFILLSIFILIVASFYFYESKSLNTNDEQKQENVGVLPDFIMADVVSFDGTTLTLVAGDTQTTVSLTEDTVLVQQIKDGNAYKNTEATIADIKVGQRMVIFYKVDGQGGYIADKVQILNF